MEKTTSGWINGFIGVAIFAGSLPATRVAVADLNPTFLTSARATIAAALALALLAALRQPWPRRADLPALARSHEVRAPALLVIGEVAAYANTLHWFGREPLTSMTAASPSLAAAA